MAERLGEALLELRTDDRALNRGIDRAERKARDLARSFDRFGQRARQVGQSFTLYVTTPIAALGGVLGRVAGDFEASMNRVAAISGAIGNEFQMLRDAATEMGRTTQFSASEAADALGFLAMAGFSAREAVDSLPGTLQLAAAAQMDLATAADIVSNVLSGYALEVAELSRVNDVLVATMTSANTDLQQLGEAMKMAGPVAAAAGVQFEETAATIGLMGNAGIQATMAGTSLRGAIARILDPAKEVSDAMAAAGLSFTDAEGRLLPLVDIIRQLEPHADDAGLFMQLFGQRAGPAMAALVSQGSDALAELTGQLEEAGGTAERIAEAQMQGLNGQIARLKSAFEALLIAIGDSGFLATLTSLAEGLTDIITRLSEASPETLQLVTAILALVAAGGPLIWMLGLLASSFGVVLRAGASLMGMLRLLVGSAGLRMLGGTIATVTRHLGLMAGAQVAATAAGAGLRVGLTALLGLIGGPLGAAIAGIIVSIGLFAAELARTRARVAELEEAERSLAEMGEELRAQIDGTTNAVTDSGAAAASATGFMGQLQSILGNVAEAYAAATTEAQRFAIAQRGAQIAAAERRIAEAQADRRTRRLGVRAAGSGGPLGIAGGMILENLLGVDGGIDAEIRGNERAIAVARSQIADIIANPDTITGGGSDVPAMPEPSSVSSGAGGGTGGASSGESAAEAAERRLSSFIDLNASLREQQLQSEMAIAANAEEEAELSRRQVEWRHRELTRRIAAEEDLSDAQREELQTIADNIRANEEAAIALDAIRARAHEALAALDRQAEADEIGRAIEDLMQARGDFGAISAIADEMLRTERQLLGERERAARRLAQLEAERAEAAALRNDELVADLDELIAQQRRYADLVDETTAAQIVAQRRMQDAFDNFTDGLSNSLLDIVTEFDGSLDSVFDVFKQLLRDLLRPQTDSISGAIAGGLQGLFGGIFGGGGKTPKFAGGFFKGGLIPSGSFGIVGERGPEPVFATAQGAKVLPNAVMSGGLGGAVRVALSVTTDGEWINTRIADVSGGVVELARPGIVADSVDEVGRQQDNQLRSNLDGY